MVVPTVVLAGLNVFLLGKFDGDASDLNVYIEGMDAKLMSNVERGTFHLNDNILKKSLEKYYNQPPDKFFLRKPTPWGDVFKKYGWYPVERRLTPESGTITDISSETVVLVHQVVKNYSMKKAYFSVGVSREVENVVWSTWTKDGDLTVNQNTDYTINFNVVKQNKDINFRIHSPWGKNIYRQKTMRVGSTSPLKIDLDPGQIVIAELAATKDKIQFQIEYEAYLAGYVFVSFEEPYKGHYFHAADVAECMRYVNLTNFKTSQEVVNIDFYTDAKLTVYNYRTSDVLMQEKV